ncbi:MAG: hypothetical protein ACYDDS_15145 [Candidatus Sulfotelmatobacter sp.]
MKISLTKTIKARLRIVSFSVMTVIVTLELIGGADAGGTAGRHAQSSSAIQTQSYEGMITDTHCGAKHSAALGMAAAECTRTCVHGGEQFALVEGDSVYVLEGHVEALKRTAGQRARIVGILNGNRISVSGVAAGE